jgi:hypothetical protein
MKLFDFDRYFSDEAACIEKFKAMREVQGVVCPKCGCKHLYWKTGKKQYQCSKCGHRMGLKVGTVLENTKLPFRYWFIAMHLLTATKHTFSASEIQRQLGHKRYQPIWEMVHKLRSIMGKRDEEYMLKDQIELDEAFFSTETLDELKNEKLKAGAGSQKKSKVLVMTESKVVAAPAKNKKPKKVGYIKMIVIPNLQKETIDGEAVNAIDKDSVITTDASKSHSNFKDLFKEHNSQVVAPKEIEKVLPWVHTVISNSKSLLTDTYHGVKKELLQGYLNEFCYKFNRRYFGEALFDRLLLISTTYQSDFKHRLYEHGRLAA